MIKNRKTVYLLVLIFLIVIAVVALLPSKDNAETHVGESFRYSFAYPEDLGEPEVKVREDDDFPLESITFGNDSTENAKFLYVLVGKVTTERGDIVGGVSLEESNYEVVNFNIGVMQIQEYIVKESTDNYPKGRYLIELKYNVDGKEKLYIMNNRPLTWEELVDVKENIIYVGSSFTF